MELPENSSLEIPTALLEQVREGKVILFLGSGASKGASHPDNASPPLGDELGRRIAARFLGEGFENRSLIQASELAISETDLVTVQQFVADQFRLFQPASFHQLVPKIPWKAIATTNYDLIVERAYDGCSSRVQELVPFFRDGQRVEERLARSNTVPYYKLHGCLTDAEDPTTPLILTVEQYNAHSAGRQRLYGKLFSVAYEHPIVFVGHSLADADIRGALSHVAASCLSLPRSYIVSPGVTSVEARFWQGKGFTVLDATFERFLTDLNDRLPQQSLRKLAPQMLGQHPLQKHLRTTDSISGVLRTFVSDDCQLVHPALTAPIPDAQAFYRGYFSGWGAIAHELDFARSLTEKLLLETVLPTEDERESKQEFVLLKGHAGSGKSITLHRLAWDAACEHGQFCLFARHTRALDFAAVRELARLSGKRLFIFFDGAARHRHQIEEILTRARAEKLSVTVFASERNARWNVLTGRLREEQTQTYELRYLNEDEIDFLLGRLEQHGALGRLREKSPEERVRAFQEVAGRQLLVALHEATSGKPFEDIVYDEYRSIASPLAQAVYRTVAIFHRLGVPTRAGLLNRVHGITFQQFRDELFEPLERIVFARGATETRDARYETRHPIVANLLFERTLENAELRHDEYLKIVSYLDVDFEGDRTAMRGLAKARALCEIFPDKEQVVSIIQAAQSRAPEEVGLLQQEAIAEMTHADGDLSRADAVLQVALEREPQNAAVLHSVAELSARKAVDATNPVEKKHLRGRAKSTCSKLLQRPRHDARPYHTLMKIALDELTEENSGDPTILAELVRDAEALVQRAQREFPEESHILDAESKLSEVLGDSPRALEALDKAFLSNPRSSYLALRYAKVLAKKNLLPDAIAILQKCVGFNPTDKDLHYQLGRSLLEQDGETEDACYHLRHSFTQNDANYFRQFWYARTAYILGNVNDAERVFENLDKANVPFRERSRPRATLTAGPERTPAIKSGVVDYIGIGHGFVIQDGTRAKLYSHASWHTEELWSSLRQHQRVSFSIAFNFRGPVAVEIQAEA